MGGVQKTNIQIINQIDKNIFKVHVSYFEKGFLFEDLDMHEIEVFKLGKKIDVKSMKNLNYIIKLCKYIKKNNIKIIHSIDMGNYLIGSIASKITGTINVRTQPNLIKTVEKTNSKFFSITPFSKWTHQYFTLNNQAKNDLISLGVPAEKVNVIYGYASPKKFLSKKIEKDIRKEFSLSSNTKIILAMHRLVEGKGLEKFIETIPIILNKQPEVKFFIVGDGPLKAKLEKRVNELKINDCVIFTGYRKDDISIAKQITFAIYPEGKSAAMATVLRVGKVLISNVDGVMGEYITHEKNGYLVKDYPSEYAKWAVKLLNSPEDLVKLEKEQYKFASTYFNGEKNIKKFECILIKLTGESI